MAEDLYSPPGSQRETLALLGQLPIWSRYTRPLRVAFPVANSRLDVAHTLGVIPNGFQVVWADAAVTAAPGVQWTPTTAYLQADAGNANAVVIFFELREEEASAGPPQAPGLTTGKPPSGLVLHAPTHQPGGTDPLVNAAWVDQANVFTQYQTINTATGSGDASLFLNQTNPTYGVRKFRIINFQDSLKIWRGEDNAELFSLSSAGALMVLKRLQIGGTTTGYPAIRNTGATLDVVSADEQAWNPVCASSYYAMSAGNSFGDLTIRAGGALTVNGSITTVGGDINAGTDASKGNIYSTYPIYPGRQDTGWTKQNSWYLGSHISYGLWSNTGLYLSGGLWVAGVVSFATDTWHTAGGTRRLHFGAASGITFIEGNGITFRNASDADVGTLSSAGNMSLTGEIRVVGSVISGYYCYPGAITNPGVQQTSWYLAGHSSYGLYINTGLYTEGDVWCNQVQARGFVFSPGFRCRTGSSGSYGGSVFNINWTGAVPLYIDATLIGNIAFGSDARIKRDFTPLVNSLEKVLQMRPGTFYYRKVSETVDPDLHLGLLAQDVLPIAPEVVRNTGMVTPLTPDGMFQISYIEMVPMLVAAIQELEQRVAKLSGGINGNIHD